MNIALIGPPAAGKGTIARQLCSEYGLTLISAGELLRREGKTGSELGKLILSYIDNGFGPPSEITVNLICRELLKSPDGVVIDNFPRNMEQAEAFEHVRAENNIKLDAVLCVTAPRDVLLDRMLKRTVCSKCEKPHHIETAIPKTPGICDDCGAPLIKRVDDTPEKLNNRIRVFMETTTPVIEFYREKGLLWEIKSAETASKSFFRVQAALNAADARSGVMNFVARDRGYSCPYADYQCHGCYHACTSYTEGATFYVNGPDIIRGGVYLCAGEYAPCGKVLPNLTR